MTRTENDLRAVIRWARRNPERVAEYKRRWIERHPEKRAEAAKAWIARNPEKRKAQCAVNNAIRDGRMRRGACEVCGGKAQAHHHDYSKPFDVRWLCAKHHAAEHRTLFPELVPAA